MAAVLEVIQASLALHTASLSLQKASPIAKGLSLIAKCLSFVAKSLSLIARGEGGDILDDPLGKRALHVVAVPAPTPPFQTGLKR